MFFSFSVIGLENGFWTKGAMVMPVNLEYIVRNWCKCGNLKNDNENLTEKEINYETRRIVDRLIVITIKEKFEDKVLIEALMKLRKIERLVVVLHFVEGMELKKIAYLFGMNIGSVYVQKSTALKKLRNIYEYVS